VTGAQTGKPGRGEVVPGQRWALRLSFQDDQLLAEEHVLQQQFRLTARQVQGRMQDKVIVVRPCPLTKMTFDSPNKGMQIVMREGKG
jgi:hypothetical protein